MSLSNGAIGSLAWLQRCLKMTSDSSGLRVIPMHMNKVFRGVQTIRISFLLGIAAVFLGQPTTLAQRLPPPALMVSEDESSTPLKLSAVDAVVRISGHVAETRMTMTFYNPQSRDMAGDLFFPLPEGATVSGYALDIEGKMVDGVVVPKDKARRVFEIEMRKGIDPGLVEWVKGNNFKTRVFPIPPRGTRTVMVRYVTQLVRDGQEQNYQLPLNFRDEIGKFQLRVEVIKPNAPPKVSSGKLANFAFDKWEDSFVAETRLQNQPVVMDLMVAVPNVGTKSVQVDKDQEGTHFFSTQLTRPKVVNAPAAQNPKRVALYWDASGSMSQIDRSKELSVIKQLCKRLQNVTIDLVSFRNRMSQVRTFEIKDGKTNRLLAALRNVDYDGGTQIGVLKPIDTDPDLYILCSDGLSNFGKETPKRFPAPLYAIGSSVSTNHAFLRFLSQRSGGAYFNLSRRDTTEVANAIGKLPFSYLRTEVIAGQVDGIYPSVPQPMSGDFVLAGRLASRSATIRIHYGIAGGPSSSEEFVIRQGDASQTGLLRVLWAQKRIDELMMAPQRNEDALIETGQEYGLVTQGTSLMVLENLDQYLEYQIEPPATLPDVRREYVAQSKERKRQQQIDREGKIDRVLALWNERVKWWKRDFKYAKNLKVKGSRRDAPGGLGGLGGGGGGLGLGGLGGGGANGALAPARPGVEETTDLGIQAEDNLGEMSEDQRRDVEQAILVEGEDSGERQSPKIKVKPWDPETPYLKVLKKAAKADRYRVYLEQRVKFAESPAFYLDCADFFQQSRDLDTAVRILSNIVELELENPALYRVAAHRLAQIGELELARMLFEQVLKMRPEEPQSHRDLALVLDQLEDFEGASELLKGVVLRDWDRFEEIEVIALMELNRVLARAERAGVSIPTVDARLIKLLDVDVRIILTWDTDLSDMDLWVTEPSGEKAFYGNNRTRIGGLVSRDFTNGYGPEEYILKKSMKGEYAMDVDYFGANGPSLIGPVTLQIEVFTNYGRVDEERQTLTVRLNENKDRFRVGKVSF